MGLLIILLALCSTAFAGPGSGQMTVPKMREIRKVLKLDLNSSVNPATLDYFTTGFAQASKDGFDLVAIRINTPGGLVSVTKDILTLFGESDLPVLVWVGPEGASATSAGAIIAAGAHLLYMSEGTNIGAASPVSMTTSDTEKSLPSTLQKKSVNDLVALVSSLAEGRGRNAQAYAKMITEASSYSSRDALKLNIIDGLAPSLDLALAQANGREIRMHSKKIILKILVPAVSAHEMGPGQKLLDVLANPSLAYVLFLLGAALIYFELQAPGGFVAGGTGVMALILAGFSFQLLPLNLVALALILLSFALIVVEMYVTSFGLLSIAGLVSLVMGSLFLFRGEAGQAEIPLSTIASVAGGIGVFLLAIGYFWAREARKEKGRVGQGFEGEVATVIEVLGIEGLLYKYQVKVKGEIWRASSEAKFSVGATVLVITHDRESLSLAIGQAKGET